MSVLSRLKSSTLGEKVVWKRYMVEKAAEHRKAWSLIRGRGLEIRILIESYKSIYSFQLYRYQAFISQAKEEAKFNKQLN
jgi:hypothetical protein